MKFQFIAAEKVRYPVAVVLDLGSRRVVGWAVRSSLEVELVLAALHVALATRQVPQLHHSDRGTQYASYTYRQLLEERGITVSMSRVGTQRSITDHQCSTRPHRRPLFDSSNLSFSSFFFLLSTFLSALRPGFPTPSSCRRSCAPVRSRAGT